MSKEGNTLIESKIHMKSPLAPLYERGEPGHPPFYERGKLGHPPFYERGKLGHPPLLKGDRGGF
jgi:hypothetical protein